VVGPNNEEGGDFFFTDTTTVVTPDGIQKTPAWLSKFMVRDHDNSATEYIQRLRHAQFQINTNPSQNQPVANHPEPNALPFPTILAGS